VDLLHLLHCHLHRRLLHPPPSTQDPAWHTPSLTQQQHHRSLLLMQVTPVDMLVLSIGQSHWLLNTVQCTIVQCVCVCLQDLMGAHSHSLNDSGAAAFDQKASRTDQEM